MKKLLAFTAIISLTGCQGMTQEEADAKMAKGCEAAITALTENDKTVFDSPDISFDESAAGKLRRITYNVTVDAGGWDEEQRRYSCLFAEQWGLFKAEHVALLEQISTPEETLGRVNGIIEGDMQQFMRIVDQTDTVMGQ